MKYVYWISLFLLLNTWIGYYYILRIISHFLGRHQYSGNAGHDYPNLTVIIAAHNEEASIGKRLSNLLQQNYPPEKLEIIVASDGSSDKTAAEASKIGDPRIKVLDFPQQRGRAAVHNEAAQQARGEILVFTDAETSFHPDFLQQIVIPYRNPKVGATVGRLIYLNASESGITESASRYWDFESKLREAEDRLGILAFGSGACMSCRRYLFRAMDPTEDIDYALSLDIVRQGYKIAFVPEALAYDYIAARRDKTLKIRVRQTSKSFLSILKRLFSHEIIVRPWLFLGIFFHKTMRHLTPFALLSLFLTNLCLYQAGLFYQLTLVGQSIFYAVALVGISSQQAFALPRFFRYAATFLILNVGRFIGVSKALFGKVKATY